MYAAPSAAFRRTRVSPWAVCPFAGELQIQFAPCGMNASAAPTMTARSTLNVVMSIPPGLCHLSRAHQAERGKHPCLLRLQEKRGYGPCAADVIDSQQWGWENRSARKKRVLPL